MYEFGPFRLDPTERILSRNGNPVPLTAKAFDTLLLLVQRSGHLLEKAELLHAIWPDSFVEEGNLKVIISGLRKSLEDAAEEQRYIQTVAKHGYRFVGDVRSMPWGETELPTAKPSSALPMELPRRQIRLALAIKAAVLAFGFLGAVAIWMRLGKPLSPAVEKTDIHSLAVLPFEPLNLDADQKYLGMGIADAVITRLGSTGQIIVRPSSSVAKYAASTADPSVIGREQKVDAILEGKIESLQDHIRVRVQLVRVRDGFLIWADTFVENQKQIFALEEKVAERVVMSIPLQVSDEAKTRLARAETENSKAYSLHLYGRYFLNKRTASAVRNSIDYFHRSIAEDPQYAPAYADLAGAYVLLGSYGVSPEQMYPHAEEAALKAAQLDGSLAAAHASLAMVSFHYAWKWDEAEKEFQTAIALNPNSAMVHAWYAQYLAAMGRGREAMDEGKRAQELDPVSPAVNTAFGRILYLNRDYDRAIEQFHRVITIEPQFSNAITRLGVAYLAKGDLDDAIRQFEKAREFSSHDPYLDGLFGYAEALNGNTKAARNLIDDLVRRSHGQYVPAFSIALVYIGLGDYNRALDWLDKAYKDHSTYLVYSRIDTLLDPLRSDPRFVGLIHKMGL